MHLISKVNTYSLMHVIRPLPKGIFLVLYVTLFLIYLLFFTFLSVNLLNYSYDRKQKGIMGPPEPMPFTFVSLLLAKVKIPTGRIGIFKVKNNVKIYLFPEQMRGVQLAYLPRGQSHMQPVPCYPGQVQCQGSYMQLLHPSRYLRNFTP